MPIRSNVPLCGSVKPAPRRVPAAAVDSSVRAAESGILTPGKRLPLAPGSSEPRKPVSHEARTAPAVRIAKGR
jgi:hypothetical protein